MLLPCIKCSAAAFSCSLFAGLSSFSILCINWKSCSVGCNQMTDLANKEYLISFALRNPFVTIYEAARSCSFWLNLSREYNPARFRMYPATSINRHIIRKRYLHLQSHIPDLTVYSHILLLMRGTICMIESITCFVAVSAHQKKRCLIGSWTSVYMCLHQRRKAPESVCLVLYLCWCDFSFCIHAYDKRKCQTKPGQAGRGAVKIAQRHTVPLQLHRACQC